MAKKQTAVSAAVQSVIAPAAPALAQSLAAVVASPLEGVLLPTEAGAFQSYGERVGKADKELGALVRMIVDAMVGKSYEQVMEDRKQFVVGYCLVRKGQTKAAGRFWERNVRALAVELNHYPESTKSSAKREPSEAAKALEALSDADAKAKLADAAKSGNVADMAKFSGLLAKREKAANAEANKAKTEARAKAWKPLKETLDTFDAREILIVTNFAAIVLKARGSDAKLKALAKMLKASA